MNEEELTEEFKERGNHEIELMMYYGNELLLMGLAESEYGRPTMKREIIDKLSNEGVFLLLCNCRALEKLSRKIIDSSKTENY